MTNFNGRRTVRMRNKQNNCSNNRPCACVRVCVCVSGLYLNLQPSSRDCWAFLRTLVMPRPLIPQPHCPLPTHRLHHRTTTIPEMGRLCTPTPWAHIVLSVWRLPLLNNKLYFAAFKSNFLTFFNLNGNAWNGKHAHHHKYPQTQAHKRWRCHIHIRMLTQRNVMAH